MPREVLQDIERATKEGRLWEPEKLIEDLMLSQQTEYRQRQVLLAQVALAVDMVDGQWLSDVSGFCYQGGFGWASEGWIERHVGVIPSWARTHSGRPRPRASSRRAAEGASGTSRSRPTSVGSGVKGRSPSSSRKRWRVVEPKRPRKWSPIKWEERKIKFGSGCWKCGEWGHYEKDCCNVSLCNLCQERGHQTRECPKAKNMRSKLEDSRRKISYEVGPSVSVVEATSTLCGRPQEERRQGRTPKQASCSKGVVAEQKQQQVLREATSTSCSQDKPTSTKAPKFKKCLVPWCKSNFFHKKGHTFGYHYPTGLAMEEDQDTRAGMRVEALRYLARELVGPTADVDDLVRYLNNSGHLRGRENNEFDRWTSSVVAGVAVALGLPLPGTMTCSPLNSPGCVFHYRVMLQVVILLGERGHYEFMRRFGLPEKREELEARCPRPEGSEELELECPKPSSTGASPVRNLWVERDVEGGREVFLVDQLERESCSTSAVVGSSTSSTSVVALPEGVIDVAEETSSLDQEVHSLSDSLVSISPRRSWRPAPSPELQLSDMEVVDEVGEEEVAGGEDDGHRVRTRKEALSFECVDSHFHLDRLCQKIQVTPWSYQKALQMVKPCRSSQQVEVDGAVAVWCDPETYPTRQQVAKLRKERVVSVIGIHPSKVHEDDVVRRLKEKLDECDVVGLGEIGIDGTKKDLPLQRTVFDEVLGLLESRSHLVLVLHCRPGRGQDSSSSYFELFYRCKAALRPEQKIHLHCFNGTMEDVDLWLGYFPNTHFGYSLMVQRADFKADSRSTLQRIDSSRLLLESDAPYFKYDNQQEWSSPSFIGLTAQEVARVIGCTRDELLKITAQNAQQLYWW